MARRSLRPNLNQIRGWVREGRTDAWIAHKLEVTVEQLRAFKAEHSLDGETASSSGASTPFEGQDLRAQDDATIAAELEAQEVERAELAATEAQQPEGAESDEETSDAPKRRRRRRPTRDTADQSEQSPLEGTFDHGEEGYGLWLDPAIADNPIYSEHWAGHRSVTVTVEADQIVIRRTG